MKIFDSKTQSGILEKKISESLEKLKGVERVLAIIQVGNNESSNKFVDLKVKLCEKYGILCEVKKINDVKNNDDEIYEIVENVFSDERISGGIIQLPLPRRSLYRLLDLIPLEKDIDVISTEGKKRFYSGDFSKLPPVVMAFENFSSNCEISYKGLKAVLIGEGDLVGKPISHYLSKKGADVKTISDYKSKDKLDCDLLVLSAGIPNLVKGENISEGCNVVDFGSSVIDGKCVGDLDMKSSIEHLGCISKSPGGMGPLVVRYLLFNFIKNIPQSINL